MSNDKNVCPKHNTTLRNQVGLVGDDGRDLDAVAGICDDCINEEKSERKSRLHAHFQIQYPSVITQEDMDEDPDWEKDGYVAGDVITCETLRGIDPRNKGERQRLHNVLDEYIDKYLIPSLERVEKGEEPLGVDRPSLEEDQVQFLLEHLQSLYDKAKKDSANCGLLANTIRGTYEALLAMQEADKKHEAFFCLYALVDKH